MPCQTIKITGVPEELVRLLDIRVKERHIVGRSEYLRDLIRKDVLGGNSSLMEILAPVHAATRNMNLNESELDTFFDNIRDEIFAEKSSMKSS